MPPSAASTTVATAVTTVRFLVAGAPVHHRRFSRSGTLNVSRAR